MLIKLTRKLVGNYLLRVSPHWVSNGHWVVSKDLLRERERYESAAIASAWLRLDNVCELTDEEIERAMKPRGERVKMERSPWVFSRLTGFSTKFDDVIFVVETETRDVRIGTFVGIDRKYADGFCLETVWGEGTREPIANKQFSPTIVVMPRRMEMPAFPPKLIEKL